jgi:hypothetical protein
VSAASLFAHSFDVAKRTQSSAHTPFLAHLFSCAKDRIYAISQLRVLFLCKNYC